MATIASQTPAPSLEVRCGGCGETLEVEPGLTDFICPDCATPQSLPPELMPRKKKALPLPRGVDSTKIQLPCASCNTALNVPHGLSRFVCPKCDVELAVDRDMLKKFLVGSSGAAAAVEVIPCGVRFPQAGGVEQCTPDSVITPSSRTGVASSVETGQTEEVAITPPPPTISTLGQSKRGRKCLAQRPALSTPLSPKYAEPSLRRSKRLATNSAMASGNSKQPQKKQKQPLSNQSQPGEIKYTESQLEPQDIARHYNELFSMDIDQLLTDSPQPHSETDIGTKSDSQHCLPMEPGSDPLFDPSLEPHLDLSPDLRINPSSDPHLEPSLGLHQEPSSKLHPDQSCHDKFLAEPDDEGDETYAPEADSSECESGPESVVLKSLRRLRKRSIDAAGAYKSSKGTRGRGPNRCLEVWNRPDNVPIEVEFNHLGQPIGNESVTLTSFLGLIARDGKLMPLNVLNRKEVPIECKDTIWLIVKSKFKLQEVRRAYVMNTLSRLWSNWKAVLKKQHYDVHDNDETRLADVNKRIRPEQWSFLVHFWSSEEGQRLSAINKARRMKVKNVHTTGTKSFARIREEEKMKRPNKEEPSRAEMFILTRTRKDGTALDEESAELIARLHEELKNGEGSSNRNHRGDLLSDVLGGKDKKYLRTFGSLPPKIYSSGSSETKSKVDRKIAANARLPEDKAAEPMNDKMKEMEKRHKDMEEEMSRMRSTMMAMQHFISTQQHLSDQMGTILPGFTGGNIDGK